MLSTLWPNMVTICLFRISDMAISSKGFNWYSFLFRWMKTTATQCLFLILKFTTTIYMIFLMRLQWILFVQSKLKHCQWSLNLTLSPILSSEFKLLNVLDFEGAHLSSKICPPLKKVESSHCKAYSVHRNLHIHLFQLVV